MLLNFYFYFFVAYPEKKNSYNETWILNTQFPLQGDVKSNKFNQCEKQTPLPTSPSENG